MKRQDNPLPIVEGWDLHLYCQYTVDVGHDVGTHGVSFGGHSRAEARREAKEQGWILHRNGFATCPACARRLREIGK